MPSIEWFAIILLYAFVYWRVSLNYKIAVIYLIISIFIISMNITYNDRNPHIFDFISILLLYIGNKHLNLDKNFILTFIIIYWLFPLVSIIHD
ncbi:hypothetical protein CRG86_007370 [Photobacterium leiognathi]|nr:hypothetical protein CRG86_007370 [Photobacterium leiognathi]